MIMQSPSTAEVLQIGKFLLVHGEAFNLMLPENIVTSMGTVLPLNFYCRNARLYLKKAAFSKKSQLFGEELSHLRKFDALISKTIPAHPLYEERKSEKQILELQALLVEARKRIAEIDEESYASSPQSRSKGHKSHKSSKISKSSVKSPKGKLEGLANAQASQEIRSPTSRSHGSPKNQQNWLKWVADNGFSVQSSFSASNCSPTSKRQLADIPKINADDGDVENVAPGLEKSPHTIKVDSDQRLEAILGNCAFLATQLHSMEEKHERSDLSIKNNTYYAHEGVESSPDRKSTHLGVRQSSRNLHEWNSSQEHSKDSLTIQKDLVRDTQECSTSEGCVKSPHKEASHIKKFRYSSESFEKRLQEKINRLRFPYKDDDNCRDSKSRKYEDSPWEGSPRESPLKEGRPSSPSKIDKRRPSIGIMQSQSFERMDHGSFDEGRADKDQYSAENDQLGGKLGFLEDHTPETSQKRKESGKRVEKRTELKVVDDIVHSEPSETGSTSLLHVPSNQEKIDGYTNSSHHLHRKSSTSSNIREDSQEICDDNVLSVSHTALNGLQVEALEDKITNLQNLVGELKGSIESFTMRVEEDGERSQGKVEGMEKNLKCFMDETRCELTQIKESMKDELKMRLDELIGGLGRADRPWESTEPLQNSSKNLMEDKIEECSEKVDFLQKQVDCSLSETKKILMKKLKEKITVAARTIRDNLKSEMEFMEVGMSKELEIIRQEMNSHLEFLRADAEQNRGMEEKLTETRVEEKIGESFPLHMDGDNGHNQNTIDAVKEEIHMLWLEVQALSEGNDGIQGHVEQLAQIAGKVQENISKEQSVTKSEFASLKKQLQQLKRESSQNLIDDEDFKSEIKEEIENLKKAYGKLKEETENMRTDFASKDEVNGLKIETFNLLKALERVEENEINRKEDLEGLKQAKEELEKTQGSSKFEGARERMLIMEKVESLSQLFLGGLEEVRTDLLNMKLNTQDRLGDIEKQWGDYRDIHASKLSSLSLRELVLDSLETRVADLESNMESKQEQLSNFEQQKLHIKDMLSHMEKDRELTAAAATETANSATKARELVLEIQESTLEVETASSKSIKLQESLNLEREMVITAVSEARRVSADLNKAIEMALVFLSEARKLGSDFNQEKEMAIISLSEARRKSHEILEGLEQERSNLQNKFAEVEKERYTVAAAAAETAKTAAKAQAALAELMELRRKTVNLQDHLNEAVTQVMKTVEDKCFKEIDKHIEDMKICMSEEVSKAKSMTEQIEEERRTSLVMADMAVQVAETLSVQKLVQERLLKTDEELTNIARTIEDYREEDKQACLSIQQDVHSRLQRTNDELETVTNIVDQLNESKELSGLSSLETREIYSQIETIQRDLTCFAQKLGFVSDSKKENERIFAAAQKEMKDKLQRSQEELKDLSRKLRELTDSRQAILAEKDEIDNRLQRNEDGLTRMERRLESLSQDKHRNNQNIMEMLEERLERTDEELACLASKLEDFMEDLIQGKQENNQAILEKLEERLEKTDEELAHIAKAVQQRIENKPDCGQFTEPELLKNEVTKLRGRINEVFETVSHLSSMVEGDGEGCLVHNINKLENKLVETTAGQSRIGEQILHVAKRVEDLESRQQALDDSVESVRLNAEDMQKSNLELVPKYEEGTKILNELEHRLATLENSENGKAEHGVQFRREAEALDYRVISQGLNVAEQTPTTMHIETRMLNIENRIDHVESTTVTSLRILDAKMEHFSVGVQTALEGAAMAESKCGALGAELVKVFRMLASSRKDSPSKMHEADDSYDHGSAHMGRKQIRLDAGVGTKLKAPMSYAACSYCKKPVQRAGECGCRSQKEGKEINVKLGQTEEPNITNNSKDSSVTTTSHARQPGDGSSRIRLKHPAEARKTDSDIRASEAKLPISMERSESTKKESVKESRWARMIAIVSSFAPGGRVPALIVCCSQRIPISLLEVMAKLGCRWRFCNLFVH
eukprot:Gb_21080 [translate_table: standard]